MRVASGNRPSGNRPSGNRRGAAADAVGLALGYTLDMLLADPRSLHPVAGFGRLAGEVERRMHRDSRLAGTAYAGGLTAAGALAGAGLAAVLRRGPARAALTAGATWTVLGGASLRREALLLQRLVGDGDLPAARSRLSHLCGRDGAALDGAGLARAVVESVAENTSDAVVAPLLWGAVAGAPGLLGYRAVNTLDAMVGHRSPRYLRFGWAAARLDDAANLLPARLTAVLAVLLAPLVGGRRKASLRVWRRDGHKHPSPNAGPVEAAFAGALGRTLGGPLSYSGRVEDRPLLGDGPAPGVGDIGQAVRLSRAVSAAAAVLSVGLRVALDRSSRQVTSGRPPANPGSYRQVTSGRPPANPGSPRQVTSGRPPANPVQPPRSRRAVGAPSSGLARRAGVTRELA